MRIVTYNIHGCVGGDRRRDPWRILRVLAEMRADVVALQEVESRHGDADEPLAMFADALGLHAIEGPTLLRDGGRYGNAVLTRWPVVGLERLDLAVTGREPRGAIDVLVRHHEAPVRVIATHLGLSPAERRRQIEQLLTAIGPDPEGLAVLLGDLNEWWLWGRPLRRLHRIFAPTAAPATFPARLPLLALDRIWVHPGAALASLRTHRSALARIASDHLPVVADLHP